MLLLQLIVQLFAIVLVFRIVVEMVQSFSRNWRPQRWFSILAEPIFQVTDPPIKLLRRLIPPVRMGNVSFDLAVLVLFLILQVLQWALSML